MLSRAKCFAVSKPSLDEIFRDAVRWSGPELARRSATEGEYAPGRRPCDQRHLPAQIPLRTRHPVGQVAPDELEHRQVLACTVIWLVVGHGLGSELEF